MGKMGMEMEQEDGERKQQVGIRFVIQGEWARWL